ncbi:hypothetical protein HYY74_03550 [Candidatus Woesearchaeota archaeon]|nr:hypothetical protein [Candidatus Woesearchaeota archaeon]
MGYIRRNVNLFLLLLIIVALGVMAGLSAYYQVTYKNLSGSYDSKLQELNQLNYNLSVQRAQLSQLNEELQVKAEAKDRFDVLYTNISGYNERLSSDLSGTKAELIDALQRLKQATGELATAKSELDTTKSALNTQLKYTAELEADVASLRTQNCNLRKKLNETC